MFYYPVIQQGSNSSRENTAIDSKINNRFKVKMYN